MFWKKRKKLEYRESLVKTTLEMARAEQCHRKDESEKVRQYLNKVLNEYLTPDQVMRVWCWINEYSSSESLAFSADLRVLEKESELRDIQKELSGK